MDDLPSDLDLSISPADMLVVRDRVRANLIKHFSDLATAARAFRGKGDTATARRLETEMRTVVTMIHALENPMTSLTPTDEAD